VYSGPIGAILTPQLQALEHSQSLPYASSLCGACAQACPVKIDIPDVLLRLRARVVGQHKEHLAGRLSAENLAMKTALALFEHPRLLERAYRLARLGQGPLVTDGAIAFVPGMSAWTRTRDLPAIPAQSFRDWWRERQTGDKGVARAQPQPNAQVQAGVARRRSPGVEANLEASAGLTGKAGVLHRVRSANLRAVMASPTVPGSEDRQAEWAQLPRGFRRKGSLARDQVLDLFQARLAHYGVKAIVSARADVATIVGQLLAERGKKTIVVPVPLPDAWLPAGFDYVADRDLSNDALDRIHGVITGCTVAIALTGTIVLTGKDGRRATTLVPDYHLCVVGREQIVELVPEAFERLQADKMMPLTFFSGPSATVDIEMTRVAGVHGPRTVDVVIMDA
jgi:L-lactate dehydrogenase complex protein LldG